MSKPNILSVQERKDILQKILDSKTFAKSSNNIALLRFLGTSSIQNETVKESIIGIELFGKNFDLEKNGARVRVNVYNLRQKLSKYYEDEGKNDPFRLQIPKGQYKVAFIRKERGTKHLFSFKHSTYLSWGISIALLLTLLFQLSSHKRIEEVPYWHDFFTNGKSTTVFVGDVFSIRGKTPFGASNVIRDFRFNNSQEFYDYMDAHPEISSDYKPNHFTYLTYMGPASVNKFSRLFARHELMLDVKLSTLSDFQDIKANNCIYVGPLNNKNRFVSLFNYQSDDVKIDFNKIVLLDSAKQVKKQYYGETSDYSTDYVLVSRIPGPENTEQFLFFSVHDIGIVGMLDYFTEQEQLQSFQKKLPKGCRYFSAIFKVSGLERTSLNAELLYLKNIKGKYN